MIFGTNLEPFSHRQAQANDLTIRFTWSKTGFADRPDGLNLWINQSTPKRVRGLISLVNIVKDYRKMRALNDVSCEIQPGITGLLGPNGAGKSTLIKVILGLVKVTGGTGQVLGHKLGRQGRLIRAKVGYMPEDDCYIPGLSGVEVVQFSACLAGIPSVEALRRAHEILDFCGMKQERYREIETFSTGMRQKVKFAAAIVHDPEFLILDEPTSGLDPEERESLLNRIKILAEDSGKSVVISTHILPDVQSICDYALIIAQGRVRLNESLEVLNRPTSPTITVQIEGSQPDFISGTTSRWFVGQQLGGPKQHSDIRRRQRFNRRHMARRQTNGRCHPVDAPGQEFTRRNFYCRR